MHRRTKLSLIVSILVAASVLAAVALAKSSPSPRKLTASLRVVEPTRDHILAKTYVRVRVKSSLSSRVLVTGYLSPTALPTLKVKLTRTRGLRLLAHRAGTAKLPLVPRMTAALRACVPLQLVIVVRDARASKRTLKLSQRPLEDPKSCPVPTSAATSGPITDKPFRDGTAPYIDPAQQTKLIFGYRSHWLQPWRGYMDTFPATRLRDAMGIGLNVEPQETAATAKLLADEGFRRARVEYGWGLMNFDDPTHLIPAQEARMRTVLRGLKDAGVRPLLVLNSNAGLPAPGKLSKLTLTAAAAAGARQILVNPATTAGLVAGKSGFDNLFGEGRSPDVIFSSVSGAVIQLSKPLPKALKAGSYSVRTLRFAPFQSPINADGTRNAVYDEDLRGWLQYVKAITDVARDVVGADGFDVEVWNELSFGAAFLNSNEYYEPDNYTQPAGKPNVVQQLLGDTVAYLRDPARGLSGMGITNGFASQTPFAAPSNSAKGVTAQSKHPYRGLVRYPRDEDFGGTPLDALAAPSATKAADGKLHDVFIPTYDILLPEYTLLGLETETLVRDLSPITTDLYGAPHGRNVPGPGGDPLQTWITEFGIDLTGADPSTPSEGTGPRPALSAGDNAHIQAKAALRAMVAYVGKGAGAMYLYTAKGGSLGLIDQGFFDKLSSLGRFPGDDSGGPVMSAFGGLNSVLSLAKPITSPRPLMLQRVQDVADYKQFDGNGTAATPDLLNRDVLNFLPFQLDQSSWVVPTYIMTRDMAKVQRPDLPANDPARFDLPEEPMRLTIKGVRSDKAIALVFDPFTKTFTRSYISGRSGDTLTVDMMVNDQPRLLLIRDAG